MDYVPRHLIVLGGGYVGLEMAQAYRRFGSRVSIIECGRQLAGREDPDIAAEIQRILATEGIEVFVDTITERIDGRSGREIAALAKTPAGERKVEGTDVLVAVGRSPNTTGVGLEEAGIQLDARGYIEVNDRLQTSAPDVWGIGECCAGSPQFTHVSFADFRLIRDNLAAGTARLGTAWSPIARYAMR